MTGSMHFLIVHLVAYASTLPQTEPADLATLCFVCAVLVLGP